MAKPFFTVLRKHSKRDQNRKVGEKFKSFWSDLIISNMNCLITR